MAESHLYKTALKKAMALCAAREICLSEINQKLTAWGVEDRDMHKITSHLIKEKFIDERRYAFAFVKDKFTHRRWGRIKLSYALRMKDIADETIREALETIEEEIYVNTLKSLIANHRKTLKPKNLNDLKGKLYRFCISKGFESHLIYDLLNEDK